MYEVDEKKILKYAIINSMAIAYEEFEINNKTINLKIYNEFFWQVYNCLYYNDFLVEKMSVIYIHGVDKVDPNIFNTLFLLLQESVKKYGIKMNRISFDRITVQFDKKINSKVYYVDSIDALEAAKRSILQ